MRGVPLRSIGLAVLAGILILVAFLPDPSVQDVSSWSNEQLLESLATDRPHLQRQVIRQLVARSKTVIPVLEESVTTANRAQLSGILDVLEELLLSPDDETSEQAEAALERMTRDPRQRIAERSLQVLYGNATLRHARSMAHYIEEGGQFGRSSSHRWPRSSGTGGGRSGMNIRVLLLDERWEGGDSELKHITRIFPGEPLFVHVADTAKVSDKALEELQASRPAIMIRREHEACLGIVISNREVTGVGVADVTEGSPASYAGMRRGDVIVQFDGKPVRQFADLRRWSAEHQSGASVRLVVRRGHQHLLFKLQLGSDFATGNCECVEPAAVVQAVP